MVAHSYGILYPSEYELRNCAHLSGHRTTNALLPWVAQLVAGGVGVPPLQNRQPQSATAQSIPFPTHARASISGVAAGTRSRCDTIPEEGCEDDEEQQDDDEEDEDEGDKDMDDEQDADSDDDDEGRGGVGKKDPSKDGDEDDGQGGLEAGARNNTGASRTDAHTRVTRQRGGGSGGAYGAAGDAMKGKTRMLECACSTSCNSSVLGPGCGSYGAQTSCMDVDASDQAAVVALLQLKADDMYVCQDEDMSNTAHGTITVCDELPGAEDTCNFERGTNIVEGELGPEDVKRYSWYDDDVWYDRTDDDDMVVDDQVIYEIVHAGHDQVSEDSHLCRFRDLVLLDLPPKAVIHNYGLSAPTVDARLSLAWKLTDGTEGRMNAYQQAVRTITSKPVMRMPSFIHHSNHGLLLASDAISLVDPISHIGALHIEVLSQDLPRVVVPRSAASVCSIAVGLPGSMVTGEPGTWSSNLTEAATKIMARRGATSVAILKWIPDHEIFLCMWVVPRTMVVWTYNMHAHILHDDRVRCEALKFMPLLRFWQGTRSKDWEFVSWENGPQNLPSCLSGLYASRMVWDVATWGVLPDRLGFTERCEPDWRGFLHCVLSASSLNRTTAPVCAFMAQALHEGYDWDADTVPTKDVYDKDRGHLVAKWNEEAGKLEPLGDMEDRDYFWAEDDPDEVDRVYIVTDVKAYNNLQARKEREKNTKVTRIYVDYDLCWDGEEGAPRAGDAPHARFPGGARAVRWGLAGLAGELLQGNQSRLELTRSWPPTEQKSGIYSPCTGWTEPAPAGWTFKANVMGVGQPLQHVGGGVVLVESDDEGNDVNVRGVAMIVISDDEEDEVNPKVRGEVVELLSDDAGEVQVVHTRVVPGQVAPSREHAQEVVDLTHLPEATRNCPTFFMVDTWPAPKPSDPSEPCIFFRRICVCLDMTFINTVSLTYVPGKDMLSTCGHFEIASFGMDREHFKGIRNDHQWFEGDVGLPPLCMEHLACSCAHA